MSGARYAIVLPLPVSAASTADLPGRNVAADSSCMQGVQALYCMPLLRQLLQAGHLCRKQSSAMSAHLHL